MGLRGTEVAREAAAIVLRDDAFGSIVAAIREGRIIFNNIRRFLVYLLSCNISEVMIRGPRGADRTAAADFPLANFVSQSCDGRLPRLRARHGQRGGGRLAASTPRAA